jgi:VanZ family protein
VVALALWTLVIFVGTHLPPESVSLPGENLDKILHVAAYAVWGGLAGVALAPNPRTFMALLAAGLVLGGLDEGSQPLMGRDAEVLDLLADLFGVALGLLVTGLFRR